MPLTDDLARSFFDLWHHLDPVEAARFDPHGPPLALAAFDRRSVGQHAAALRSLAGAAEALAPEMVEDEIEQALLLEAIRGVERDFAPGSARLGDPAFWLSRLCETLAVRPGDEAVLAAIPDWATRAATACRSAARPAAATGAALLEWALAELGDAGWSRASVEARTAARSELQALAEALAAGTRPDAPAAGVGEEEVTWRLHYEYTLTAGAAEALRAVGRAAEELVQRLEATAAAVGPGADWREAVRGIPAPTRDEVAAEPWPAFRSLIDGGFRVRAAPAGALGAGPVRVSSAEPHRTRVVTDVRYGAAGAGGLLAARARAGSEIARRFARAGLVEAWGLFAQSGAATEADDPLVALHLLADLYRRTLVAAADLAIHQGQLEPGDALAGLADRLPAARTELAAELRGVSLRPAETAGAVLVWREWERLARVWPGGRDGLVAAVLEDGLAWPALLRWRHGVEG